MLHIVVCYNCSWLSFFSATHVHNTKPQTSGTLRWFWRCKESTIPCSYTSQSMREIQCCSKLQAAKAHRRLSKAVAKYKWTGVPGISLVVSTDWHAMSTSSSLWYTILYLRLLEYALEWALLQKSVAIARANKFKVSCTATAYAYAVDGSTF